MAKTSKKILTVQDLSCVGQCSLTVALPILSAFGLETGVLPTAILSEHTIEFETVQTILHPNLVSVSVSSFDTVNLFCGRFADPVGRNDLLFVPHAVV